MEDTLGVLKNLYGKGLKSVLILVLMEDTLGDVKRCGEIEKLYVLILVLMEDTLGDLSRGAYKEVAACLNPCFNGRYSRRQQFESTSHEVLIKSLNPCFNGRYSRSINNI